MNAVEHEVHNSRRDLAVRALVMFDALEDHRRLSLAETEELRQLCDYASRVRLGHWERRGLSRARQRGWLAEGGIRWCVLRAQTAFVKGAEHLRVFEGRDVIADSLHDKIAPSYTQASARLAAKRITGNYIACAFCSFLIAEAKPRAHGSYSWQWNSYRLRDARAHTDRCALRFLINRGK